MSAATLEVLYEDNHLLAANKPAGLATQSSREHEDSLEARARAWVKDVCAKPGNVFLHAVHRLDRPVSGVVLFARTGKALSRLNAHMRARADVGKRYLAIVAGTPTPSAGELRDFLVHDAFRARIADASADGAKEALLAYRTLAAYGGLTLLDLDLRTGRYHQIRAQLAHAGHPVAGDTRYGSRERLPGEAIALHHACLRIRHPTRGEDVVVTASPPDTAHWNRFRGAIPR